jgi:hypothetical protein
MAWLGLLFYVDTNFAGDAAPAAVELRELASEGWITIHRTDTLDTELLRDEDPVRRSALLAESSRYPESLGPFVWDQSRLDSSVIACDEDAERLDSVFRLLFPGTDRYGTSANAKRKLRDAMHVATTIRYGGTYFVTRDADDILKKREQLMAAYNLQPMTPESALAFVHRVKARQAYREASAGQHPDDLGES